MAVFLYKATQKVGKKAMKKIAEKLRGTGWIVVIITVVISIIFAISNVASTLQVRQNLTAFLEHPFNITGNVHRLRRIVAESRIYTNRLSMNHDKDDVEFVSKNLLQMEEEVEEYYAYIEAYYLGPDEDIQTLHDLLIRTTDAEQELLRIAEENSLAENDAYLQEHLLPLYDSLDQVTQGMLNFSTKVVKELTESSNDIMMQTILFSIALSGMLITLAILYQRSVVKRVYESEYQKFLFNVLSDNIDDVFMIFNIEENAMEFVSPNAKRILGIDSADIAREGMHLLFQYCDEQECLPLKQAFEGRAVRNRIEKECVMTHPGGGADKSISIRIYPAVEKMVLKRYIISIDDLSEAKRMQQVLRDALLNAQNANRAKSDFLSNMSHEIRTPMNAIIGMTTIAATVLDQPERLENCLTKIASSSKLLLMLVNDILDMSKIENGKLSLVHENFSLPKIIEEVCDVIYIQADSKEQNFNVSTDILHETLIGDALRLKQILINVLSNAVKYTQNKGNIKLMIHELLDYHKSGVKIRFTVIDDGIGMSPEFVEKLFQPFEQEHRQSSGTGLGMAITKNLVTLAQGVIRVKSEVNQGSTFIIEIPFEIAEIEENRREKGQLSDLKVLVADDDLDTCRHTSIILERIGVHANWVLSGAEAVEQVIDAYEKRNSYDVVFLDWKMPDVDGVEATRRIRKAVGPDTLIIIISAFDWSEIEKEARSAGANAFISKPMFQSTIYNALVDITQNPVNRYTKSAKNRYDFTGKRFLLAEDNEINAEIAVELLHIVHAEVDVAVNGEETVRMLDASAPGFYDAILMDVQMPVMDGYQATIAIRDMMHEDAKKIPIIAMTANAFMEDIAMAMQAGMNAHIAKPIDFDKLCEVLETEMNKR